jgi:hypothetical protein
MSAKLKRNRNTVPQATPTWAETRESSIESLALDEQIRRRAYEIYLELGEQPGRDVDDWLQAERGVLLRARAG